MGNKPGSWKRFRTRFLAIERYSSAFTCHYCGELIDEGVSPPSPNALTVDHVIPISKGGGLKDKNNVVVCCYFCNMKKGDKV